MAEAIMAFPELRHPFEKKPLHPEGSKTVLYDSRTIQLSETAAGGGLLIDPSKLPEINGFEVKPEGACLDDICIPLTEASGVLREVDGRQWFDLIAFADHVGQPWVGDEETGVWSFGEIPATRDSMMTQAMAPDFEVKDRQGNVIRLADLKGKKALIVTWSSW